MVLLGCILGSVILGLLACLIWILYDFRRFKKKNNFIESKMSKTIFRNIGTLLSQFNEIRNNNTYAHDNPILNQFESEFIYKQVVNYIIFH